MVGMRIAIGSDHAGFELKERVREFLAEWHYDTLDMGTHSTEPVDYPDYAQAVGRAVQAGEADRGIVICGSGVGASVAANKSMKEVTDRLLVEAVQLFSDSFAKLLLAITRKGRGVQPTSCRSVSARRSTPRWRTGASTTRSVGSGRGTPHCGPELPRRTGWDGWASPMGSWRIWNGSKPLRRW